MGYKFGKTYVVQPKGKHLATIVWLHGLGGDGLSWAGILEGLPQRNIKWICPTAPIRPVTILGGTPCTAWFDLVEVSDDTPKDIEGLDASSAHVAHLLSTEPRDIKLGIGGFSMGAATTLYSATCFALGKYGNGTPYLVSLKAIVGLSGWLPGSRNLKQKIEGSHGAANRAASLPVLICHGTSDNVVPYSLGEKTAKSMSLAGYSDLEFKPYQRVGHCIVPKEVEDVCKWLTTKLGLENLPSFDFGGMSYELSVEKFYEVKVAS